MSTHTFLLDVVKLETPSGLLISENIVKEEAPRSRSVDEIPRTLPIDKQTTSEETPDVSKETTASKTFLNPNARAFTPSFVTSLEKTAKTVTESPPNTWKPDLRISFFAKRTACFGTSVNRNTYVTPTPRGLFQPQNPMLHRPRNPLCTQSPQRT